MATATIGRSALARVNIVISQGADNIYQFRWSTLDDVTGVKTPVDLTGYSARSQLRQKVGGPVWAELTSDDNSITLGTDGLITVILDDTVTEDPAWNNYKSGVWDLEVEKDGLVTRFVEGGVTVSPDVTRANV
jgi:hypothetical protein